MTALRVLNLGLRRAFRHARLTIVLFLPAAAAALVMATVARGLLAPAFDPSLFAEGVLRGDWFPAWVDFTASRPGATDGLLGPVVLLLLAGVALAQVVVAAGVVGTLVERESRHPFLLGVRRHVLRFLRAAVVYLAGLVPIAILAGATAKRFFDLAESQRNGRLDLVGVAVAALVAFLLWAPWDLAYDLARVSAVRHERGSMTFGMLRALGDVLRRPLLLMPLAAAAILLPLALQLLYGALRSPWTPSTAVQIAILFVAQQVVMVGRSAIRLWIWGAAVEAHTALGEPDWCHPWRRRRPVHEASPSTEPLPEPVADLPVAAEAGS